MEAVPVLLKLVCRNAILFHVLGIGVAPTACLRNMRCEYRRVGILNWLHAVISMATNACGWFLVALDNLLAVHARGILCLLVDADRGVVLPHEFGVTVAFSAKRRHLARTGCSDKTLANIHRSIVVVIVRISSVTACARKTPSPVNIVLDLRDRRG